MHCFNKPVNSDGCQGEGRRVNSDSLAHGEHVAEALSKVPSAEEGVEWRYRHCQQTQEYVCQGQVEDEDVCHAPARYIFLFLLMKHSLTLYDEIVYIMFNVSH